MKDQTFAEEVELEVPHETYPIEWWFFQGTISSQDEQYEFMVSFFRINVSPKDEPVKSGYSVLLTFLDVKTGENYVLSQIDNSILDGIFKRIELLDDSEVDRELAKVLYQELKKHGPPRPIKLSESFAEITHTPLKISWNDLLIQQMGNEFLLDFFIPKNEKQVSVILKPKYSRILLESEERNKSLKGEMTYATYPRMKLNGIINDKKVNGEAWFDHQWGDYCWFVTDDASKKVLGWDWFGMNLSDGTDVIILIHKHMRTNEIIFASAVVHSKESHSIIYKDVSVKHLKFWESPRTHIKYPVVCQIHIPELDFEAIYEPLIDDQEIMIIGNSRAIWEGAGKVNGKLNGREVYGRARAEFYGYGYIFDFQNYLQTLADRVDKRIEEFFPKKFENADIEKFVGKPFWQHEPEAYSKLLATPVWDLISRRGKRWRPIFGILMVEALGVASLNYEASACLAELVHSGALIIDDIEDNSLLRRGEQCLHLKYGLDVAINAGNTLYFLPSVELFNHRYLSDLKKLRIHEIMMKTYLQAHFGQTVDIYWSKYLSEENLKLWMNDSLEEKILQLYDYKTAAGAKGLAEVAAVIAEVDDKMKQICIDYARAFAVAFQIVDDIHNFSDSPRWTKVCGEDISCGKLTYVIVRAIKNLESKKSSRLINILCSPEQRKNADALQEGIELVKNSGAIEECKEKAKKMSLDENNRFGENIPSCEPKIMLSMLCLKMLDLAYDT
ncbi:MAG: polyprenyl synthetase family protein [Ignavibacteriales bacterium]|nr:polyprenyl synthetase family protein [Ignavibacteriales bacterium]